MLELPDIRQKHTHDCGLAAVNVVVRYFGCRYPNLIERLASTDWDGTDPRSVEGFLRQEKFKVQSGHMSVDDLRHHTKLGRPIIVLTNIAGGHYCAVAGVYRNSVYFQDPCAGPRKMKLGEFEKIWTDYDRHGIVYDCFGMAVWY